MFFWTGGAEYGIAQFAGLVGFLIAFLCALALAPVFWYARSRLSEVPYLLLHLSAGLGIGALRAINPYATEWYQYVYNHDALLVSCASLGAWLCVILRAPAGRSKSIRSIYGVAALSPMILVLGLLVLAIPIVVAPVPTDPSCHNVFRGGRSSASPAIRITLWIEQSEKTALGDLYDRFAAEYHLSIRRHPLLPESTQRSICNDDVVIEAGGSVRDGQQSLAFYPHIGGSGWEPMANDLICRLEARWGDTLVFTGDGGEKIPRPAILGDKCPAGERQGTSRR